MEDLLTYIATHGGHAPWVVFAAMLLAGMSIPISIDVLLIVTACLAATTLRAYLFPLYISLLCGAYLSAMIAYGIGRFLGDRLCKWKFFSKLLTQTRIDKMRSFYQRYGFFALIVGRFIPFGMRNCLFMTTGMSRYPFLSFIARDALACTVWTTICFWLFYVLGENYTLLYTYLKVIGILFLGAAVAVFLGCRIRAKKRLSR